MAEQLRAGTVINCYNIFDAALPFEATSSPWGREMGHEVLNLTRKSGVHAHRMTIYFNQRGRWPTSPSFFICQLEIYLSITFSKLLISVNLTPVRGAAHCVLRRSLDWNLAVSAVNQNAKLTFRAFRENRASRAARVVRPVNRTSSTNTMFLSSISKPTSFSCTTGLGPRVERSSR